MFEKEAIIYAFEASIGIECLNKPVEDFTYEELSDEQQEKAYDFKKGAEFGYNKANEWHFVKDGDLPKYEVNVLVLYNVQCIDIAHYNYDYKEWHFRDSIVRDVIAWKEIIPPNV